MGVIPQVYPLWLAEVREQEIHAGRVVGWHVADPIDGLPGTPAATPVAAFTTPDGLLLETCAPSGPLVFIADTREEAVAAARRVAAPAPGFPPQADDEDDDDSRPPDARTRVLSMRRPSLQDLTADSAGSERESAGEQPRRSTR